MKKFNFNNISEDFDFGSVSIVNAADEASQKCVGYLCLQENQKDIIEKVLMPGVLVDEKTIEIDDYYNMVTVDISSGDDYVDVTTKTCRTIYQVLIKNGYHSTKTFGFTPLMTNIFHETCPSDIIGENYYDVLFSYDMGVIIVLYKKKVSNPLFKDSNPLFDAQARIFYTGKIYYSSMGMATYPKNSPIIKNIQKGVRFWCKLLALLQDRSISNMISGIKFKDNIPVMYFIVDESNYDYYNSQPPYQSKNSPLYKTSFSNIGNQNFLGKLTLNAKGEELYQRYINKELTLSTLYKGFPNEKLAKERENSQVLQKVDSGDSITENIVSNMKLPIKKIYKELFGGSCPVPTTTIVNKYNFGPVYLTLRCGDGVPEILDRISCSTYSGSQTRRNIGYTIKAADYAKIWRLPDMDYETREKLDAFNESNSIPGCVMTDFDKMPIDVQNVYKTFSDVRNVVITPDAGIVIFVTGRNPIVNARKYYNMVKKTRPEIGIKYYVDDANISYHKHFTHGFVLKFTGKVDYNQA